MLPFLISLLHSSAWSLIFLVVIPNLIADLKLSQSSLCLRVGIALLVLGLFLFLLSARELSREGGTTTFLKKAKKLVRKGVYRYTRNPIYLAVGLISLGESSLFCSPVLFAYTLCLMGGLHIWVVLFEEPSLRKSYGQEFEDYSREVPRWVAFPRKLTCSGRRRRSHSSQRSPLS